MIRSETFLVSVNSCRTFFCLVFCFGNLSPFFFLWLVVSKFFMFFVFSFERLNRVVSVLFFGVVMFQIGVIGSSDEDFEGDELAFEVGRVLAEEGCVLLTGACTGLPYAAVRGADSVGGTVIGVSPAQDTEEHVEGLGYPVEGFDCLMTTGLGSKGRNVVLVRSCDAVIAVGGQFGTLNELTIAHGTGKVIGLLDSVGGVSSRFEDLEGDIGRSGRLIVSDGDPESLVGKVLDVLRG